MLARALDRKDAAAVARHGGTLAPMLTDLLLAAGPAAPALAALAPCFIAGDLPRPLAERLAESRGARVQHDAPQVRVTVDPVEFRGFRYHTGPWRGDPLAARHEELGRGGRYFSGDGEPATGITLFYADAVLRAAPPTSGATDLVLAGGVRPKRRQRRSARRGCDAGRFGHCCG